jgi:hypothetical protein
VVGQKGRSDVRSVDLDKIILLSKFNLTNTNFPY